MNHLVIGILAGLVLLTIIGWFISTEENERLVCMAFSACCIVFFVLTFAFDAGPDLVQIVPLASVAHIEYTPYRIIVRPRYEDKEVEFKEAEIVNSRAAIMGFQINTPRNAWGIHMDSETKISVIFPQNIIK